MKRKGIIAWFLVGLSVIGLGLILVPTPQQRRQKEITMAGNRIADRVKVLYPSGVPVSVHEVVAAQEYALITEEEAYALKDCKIVFPKRTEVRAPIFQVVPPEGGRLDFW